MDPVRVLMPLSEKDVEGRPKSISGHLEAALCFGPKFLILCCILMSCVFFLPPIVLYLRFFAQITQCEKIHFNVCILEIVLQAADAKGKKVKHQKVKSKRRIKKDVQGCILTAPSSDHSNSSNFCFYPPENKKT